ncbi:glutathione S-transferase [Sparassis latifolia]
MSSASSKKPLLLYTGVTPNGRKVSILLEELKAIVYNVNMSNDEQKEPWYIKLNPNGKVPVLVDRQRGDFAVFETAAILLYLEQHYDLQYKFSFNPATQPNDHSEMLQWMFFAHGGIGPMQGQAAHYTRFLQEDIPYAKKRYVDETKRLYNVLNIRLANRDWLAGPGRGAYSIADINAFPWVNFHAATGIETLDEWGHVKAWSARMLDRPGVKAGFAMS